MRTDQSVEEEVDMIVHFIQRKKANWERLDDPVSIAVAGEFDDLAEEIQDGKHWEPEE